MVRGVLHRRFHVLEGHSWRYQSVVPEGKQKDLVHRTHGGDTVVHLVSTHTLALLEHIFYWPGMQAYVKQAGEKWTEGETEPSTPDGTTSHGRSWTITPDLSREAILQIHSIFGAPLDPTREEKHGANTWRHYRTG